MSGQPEVSLRAELDRCLIIAATVGNKWLLYTVIRDVLTRKGGGAEGAACASGGFGTGDGHFLINFNSGGPLVSFLPGRDLRAGRVQGRGRWGEGRKEPRAAGASEVSRTGE